MRPLVERHGAVGEVPDTHAPKCQLPRTGQLANEIGITRSATSTGENSVGGGGLRIDPGLQGEVGGYGQIGCGCHDIVIGAVELQSRGVTGRSSTEECGHQQQRFQRRQFSQ